MIPINDISHHQGSCDFKKLKAKSLGVIMKAGQGSWTDNKFEVFRNGAVQEKVPFGTYWFYDERYKPKEQAALWVDTIKGNPGVLGAWLDLEDWEPGPYNTWQHWKELMEEFKALLPAVTLGVYTRQNYFNHHVGNNFAYFAQHPLWVASFTTGPKPDLPIGWADWTIWQYTNTGDGHAHGVGSDGIDMDRYNLDEATYKQRFGITDTPTKETYRVTAQPSLRVRSTPDASIPTNIKGNVLENEIVEKLDQNADGTWFYIRNATGTLEGWSSAGFLEKVEDKKPPIDGDLTTTPAKGVTRIEGERYGRRFYLTICNPADVTIEVVHQDSRPSVIAKARKAKFAFNGDDWHRGPRKAKGMEMCNGKLHQKRTHGEPSLIVTKNGAVSISHKNVTGQWNVSSGVRYLIEGGVNKIPQNGTDLKYTERHARSIRGMTGDGRVMFLTVDGEYPDKGVRFWEAAELLLEFGCFTAFDGGGGGDSVDVMDGVIANVPDDDVNGVPVERKVPQTILVFTKPN